MNREDVVLVMHRTARELAESNGRTVVAESNGNLLESYGFSSLDALEYLLLLEEHLGVTFEDEDLSQEILMSENLLADYIAAQLA